MAEKLMRNAYATHTDYSEFKGVIADNPNLVPSNVDGMLERKSKFLILEWKRQGEKVSVGQKIMLQALAAKPDFMVLIIYGNTDNETVVNSYWLLTPHGVPVKTGVGFESFKQFYKQWYEWADGN
jgi:hypothetical protein